MLVYEVPGTANPRFIINFPTKRHWRANSRIDDIKSGLTALIDEVRRRRIRTIAVPPLGCGLGGLRWADVRPLIEKAFAGVPGVDVLLYEPAGAPAPEDMARGAKAPDMTPGRAALVGLMRRYLAGLMDPFVSLLEIHKLMYFAQEAGEPLRLKYVKAVYGPYAENLRHVLAAIEGHLVSGYADGGDAPDKQIQLLPGAAEAADAFLAAHPATRERFERVSALVEGFETPFGTELLATVHWLLAHERVSANSSTPSTHGTIASDSLPIARSSSLARSSSRRAGFRVHLQQPDVRAALICDSAGLDHAREAAASPRDRRVGARREATSGLAQR
jgi:O-acetyl-ADP-ribose deacetylase (regulator of RNase III)